MTDQYDRVALTRLAPMFPHLIKFEGETLKGAGFTFPPYSIINLDTGEHEILLSESTKNIFAPTQENMEDLSIVSARSLPCQLT